jgi:hypothetical protein
MSVGDAIKPEVGFVGELRLCGRVATVDELLGTADDGNRGKKWVTWLSMLIPRGAWELGAAAAQRSVSQISTTS